MSYVAGFTVAHDVSARDWQLQKNGKQWLLGKTFDTFCPLGPAIVTRAAISGMCVKCVCLCVCLCACVCVSVLCVCVFNCLCVWCG